MKQIQWGMIGCGDVTEVKSGPAFNKVKDSSLVAVMRRNEEKVKDYARRHGVPKWYTDAFQLINEPEINAIYIATPPSSHEEYAIAALEAGKPVYIEKPMTMDAAAGIRIMHKSNETKLPVVVAHYRRAQPLFKKIKQLIDEKAIGEPRFARLELYKPLLTPEELNIPKTAWRVDTQVAGGGLFHDLAPHQLDLMYFFFGDIEKATGLGINQGKRYAADDLVTGNILFRNGVVFDGLWSFAANPGSEKDQVEIIGSEGNIRFSVFNQAPVELTVGGKTERYSFESLQHVQQPMIDAVVRYFLQEGPNPCTAAEGVEVMKLLDAFTKF